LLSQFNWLFYFYFQCYQHFFVFVGDKLSFIIYLLLFLHALSIYYIKK
jgi:hypothetical protein